MLQIVDPQILDAAIQNLCYLAYGICAPLGLCLKFMWCVLCFI